MIRNCVYVCERERESPANLSEIVLRINWFSSGWLLQFKNTTDTLSVKMCECERERTSLMTLWLHLICSYRLNVHFRCMARIVLVDSLLIHMVHLVPHVFLALIQSSGCVCVWILTNERVSRCALSRARARSTKYGREKAYFYKV